MSDQMPTGWMSADEARMWARRGVWALRHHSRDIALFAGTYKTAEGLRCCMHDGESWRFLCAHPDDTDAALAVETVEVEAFAVLTNDDDGADLDVRVFNSEPDAARAAAQSAIYGRVAHVVRIVANVPLPVRVEPVTVRGEVKS